MSDALKGADLTKPALRENICPRGDKVSAPTQIAQAPEASVPTTTPAPAPAAVAAETDAGTGALITWPAALVQTMDRHDSSTWAIRSGLNDAQTFGSIFQPKMAQFSNGFLSLIVDKCRSNCGGMPYASGEYRTRGRLHFGYYETRMKPADNGDGLMAGSFFTYTGVWGQKSHNEIDFEFIGDNSTEVQLNYYFAGSGTNSENERRIKLGFDASQSLHNYGFEWRKDRLVFYIDGKAVHTATTDIPQKPSQLMINIWRGGPATRGWLGGPYSGRRVEAVYDWIKYAPLNSRP